MRLGAIGRQAALSWLGVFLLGFCLGLQALAAETAADFTLRDINGTEQTLSSLKGKVVVLSFWATWCGPCKEEMPHLEAMYKELQSQGLVVLSIATDDARSAARVKPFILKMGYTFPVLLDRESTVVAAYNPSKTLPYTVVIDRSGTVVKRLLGYNPGDETELKTFLTGLLTQPAGG